LFYSSALALIVLIAEGTIRRVDAVLASNPCGFCTGLPRQLLCRTRHVWVSVISSVLRATLYFLWHRVLTYLSGSLHDKQASRGASSSFSEEGGRDVDQRFVVLFKPYVWKGFRCSVGSHSSTSESNQSRSCISFSCISTNPDSYFVQKVAILALCPSSAPSSQWDG